MNPRHTSLLVLTLMCFPAYAKEVPTDFDFQGDPIPKFEKSIFGTLAPGMVKVVSVLDTPLLTLERTSWLNKDGKVPRAQIYPISHEKFLMTGFSKTGPAYFHWKLALQRQMIYAGAFSNSVGPNFAVFVVVKDIRLPGGNTFTSTAHVIANYRILNLDDNSLLATYEIETIEDGETFWTTSAEEQNASSLNVAVQANIVKFFEELQQDIDQIP